LQAPSHLRYLCILTPCVNCEHPTDFGIWVGLALVHPCGTALPNSCHPVCGNRTMLPLFWHTYQCLPCEGRPRIAGMGSFQSGAVGTRIHKWPTSLTLNSFALRSTHHLSHALVPHEALNTDWKMISWLLLLATAVLPSWVALAQLSNPPAGTGCTKFGRATQFSMPGLPPGVHATVRE
jgi:hypothetical protein